jgi:hypothetical protein
MTDQKDTRYAAGGGQPIVLGDASGKKKSKISDKKVTEIAKRMSDSDGDISDSDKNKKLDDSHRSSGKSKSKFPKKAKEPGFEDEALAGGEGGPRRGRSASPSELSHDPPSSPSRRGVTGTDAASVTSFRSFTSIRSYDPEVGEGDALGEIWEVSRPPGMVRDGGTDHGYFYLPAPGSSDGSAFHAFLNNQKYTTRRAPCVDWRAWMEKHPRNTLIHFSEVPREALVKGRHILENKPGSAFFSATQLMIEGEELWEDSGAYAQMFTYVRGGDPDVSTLPSTVGDQEFQQWRRSGGDKGGPPPPAVREDPNNVSFLRKGFNQNIVAGMVAFTGPGLFNAMQGLGNAGGSDPSVRIIHSACFCFVS